jgi:hypothetical protein
MLNTTRQIPTQDTKNAKCSVSESSVTLDPQQLELVQERILAGVATFERITGRKNTKLPELYFYYDSDSMAAGRCESPVISINTYYLDTADHLDEIVLHELCHYLLCNYSEKNHDDEEREISSMLDCHCTRDWIFSGDKNMYYEIPLSLLLNLVRSFDEGAADFFVYAVSREGMASEEKMEGIVHDLLGDWSEIAATKLEEVYNLLVRLSEVPKGALEHPIFLSLDTRIGNLIRTESDAVYADLQNNEQRDAEPGLYIFGDLIFALMYAAHGFDSDAVIRESFTKTNAETFVDLVMAVQEAEKENEPIIASFKLQQEQQ